MVDVMTAIAAIKAATDITKGLSKIKAVADSAEAKAAVADLKNNLADANLLIADLKTALVDKDDEIRDLRASLEAKLKLVRHNEMYFEKDEGGNTSGDPYCPRCFEADGKQVHLVYRNEDYLACPECEKTFPRNPGSKREFPAVAITNRGDDWDGY